MIDQLRVTLAQISPKVGDLQHNLRIHERCVQEAANTGIGSHLIVFPELSLTGYQLQDLAGEVAIEAQRTDPVYSKMLALSQTHGIDIVFGFVHKGDRQQNYIAQAYVSHGSTKHIHHKVYLPTYGMFDDQRYFAAGTSIRAFDTQYGRMGMLICEDFWHMSSAYVLWRDGADILILSSASPARGINTSKLDSSRWVEMVNQNYGGTLTNFVIHCNRVGYEDGKAFWGGSSVVDPNGKIIAQAEYLNPDSITVALDLNEIHRTRTRLPLLADEKFDLVERELARINAEVNLK